MPAQHAPATNGAPPVVVGPSPDQEEGLRDLAVKQIERRRRFQTRAFAAAALAVLLVIIWATAEYHNAGGWPTSGFSQSSGIPNKWNSWIVYPLVVIGLGVALDAWHTFRHKPISEAEIQREMDRMRGTQ